MKHLFPTLPPDIASDVEYALRCNRHVIRPGHKGGVISAPTHLTALIYATGLTQVQWLQTAIGVSSRQSWQLLINAKAPRSQGHRLSSWLRQSGWDRIYSVEIIDGKCGLVLTKEAIEAISRTPPESSATRALRLRLQIQLESRIEKLRQEMISLLTLEQ